MARINVEDSIWSDPRFMRLCILLGDELRAVGAILVAWRTAQKFWCPDKKPIPETDFKKARLPEELIECGLAQRTADGIRMCGSEDHFVWWFQRQQAGQKSARNRKEKSVEQPSTAVEQSLDENEQPSTSSSSSSSSSFSYSSSKKKSAEVLPELAGIDDELFSAITSAAQKSWVDEFGVETIRRIAPTAHASWATGQPRSSQTGSLIPLPLYVRRCLENQRRYAEPGLDDRFSGLKEDA